MYGTDYFEEQILAAFRGTTFTAPPEVYVGLLFSNPTEKGLMSSEVNYAGYSRQKGIFSAPKLVEQRVEMFNEEEITWNAPPDSIGTAYYIGVFDNKNSGAGNMLLYSKPDTPLELTPTTEPNLDVGDLLFFTSGNLGVEFKKAMFDTLRGNNFTGFEPHLALFNDDPEKSGQELSGTGYERKPVLFSSADEQVGGTRIIFNTGPVVFDKPRDSWGYMAYEGIMTAKEGGMLVLKVPSKEPKIIKKNYTPRIKEAKKYKVGIN